LLQQSAPDVQLFPFAWHDGSLLHAPLTQVEPAQHSAFVLQLVPSGKQPPHVPLTQNCPEQHSPSFAHGSPRFAQHELLTQDAPRQHGPALPPHLLPTAAQLWQVPPVQVPEQQSPGSAHAKPSSRQLPHLSL
jgi:hypothetical protein